MVPDHMVVDPETAETDCEQVWTETCGAGHLAALVNHTSRNLYYSGKAFKDLPYILPRPRRELARCYNDFAVELSNLEIEGVEVDVDLLEKPKNLAFAADKEGSGHEGGKDYREKDYSPARREDDHANDGSPEKEQKPRISKFSLGPGDSSSTPNSANKASLDSLKSFNSFDHQKNSSRGLNSESRGGGAGGGGSEPSLAAQFPRVGITSSVTMDNPYNPTSNPANHQSEGPAMPPGMAGKGGMGGKVGKPGVSPTSEEEGPAPPPRGDRAGGAWDRDKFGDRSNPGGERRDDDRGDYGGGRRNDNYNPQNRNAYAGGSRDLFAGREPPDKYGDSYIDRARDRVDRDRDRGDRYGGGGFGGGGGKGKGGGGGFGGGKGGGGGFQKFDISKEECRKCGELGHFARDCPMAIPKPITCHRCGQTGHLARDCKTQGKYYEDRLNSATARNCLRMII